MDARIKDQTEAIKTVVSFREVAESLGVKWESDGSGRFKTNCLWHDDENPSLKTEGSQANARCYSACSRNYDVFDLVQQVRGGGFGEALEYLEESGGMGTVVMEQGFRDRREGRSMSAPKPKPKPKPKRVKNLGETGRWTIRNPDGEYVSEHIRIEHELDDGEREKEVFWERNGKRSLDGIKTANLPLYRSEFMKEWPADVLVILTEGEKAADALVQAGYEYVVASVCGASSCPAVDTLEILRGYETTIWRDADKPGIEHTQKLADNLNGIASTMRVFVSGKEGSKDDAADHPAVISGDREAIDQLIGDLHQAPLAADTLPTPQNVQQLRVVSGLAPQIRHLTDRGNAQRLAALHGHEIRYIGKWGKYLAYDGRRWKIDDMCQVERWAKEVPDLIIDEAKRLTEKNERKSHFAFSLATESQSKIKAMVESLKSEPGVAIEHEVFDPDPMILNVANGTLDLRTGLLLDHDPDDMITKIAPVEYDPLATAPKWTAMLERILPEPEMRAYIKRACGYSATGRSGRSGDQVLLMPYGMGANGKSTLLGAMVDVLGEYGQHTAPDLLVKQRSDHPTVLADLFGVRALVSVETDQGVRLNEALIKRLTGGDRIRARRMREDLWEFDPTHTVWFAVNHRPEVKGIEHAIWRRVKVAPFTVQIPEEHQNKNLAVELEDEYPGILRWIVEGCMEWQKIGLAEPDAVRNATRQYREEMDVLQAFFDDRCVLDPAATTEAEALYAAYEGWCQSQREEPLSQRALGFALKERGFDNSKRVTSGPRKGRKKWSGIGLLSTDDDPDEREDSTVNLVVEEPPENHKDTHQNEETPDSTGSQEQNSATKPLDKVRYKERESDKVHRTNSPQTPTETTIETRNGEPCESESELTQGNMLTSGMIRKQGSQGSPDENAEVDADFLKRVEEPYEEERHTREEG